MKRQRYPESIELKALDARLRGYDEENTPMAQLNRSLRLKARDILPLNTPRSKLRRIFTVWNAAYFRFAR